MSNVNLADYIEVPERIRDFIAKYPDGSLQCKSVEYRDMPTPQGELRPHIIYHALAYRTPDDKRPGHGMASEPLPGMTPYTKGSELMNAETSAWGRALAALGFVSKRDGSAGVATAHEVRTRSGGESRRHAGGDIKPSEPQLKLLKGLVTKAKPSRPQLRAMLDAVGATTVEVKDGWLEELTGGKEGTASALITWFKEKPLPDPEHPSDVPSEFTVDPPAEGGELGPFDDLRGASA